MGVVDKAVGFLLLGGAYHVCAKLVDALRGESEVTHDGDSSGEYAADRFENLLAAFELDGIGTGLLHDADGGGEGLFGVALISAEGHINHHQGTLDGAFDRGGVDYHLVEGDGQGSLVTFHDIGGRVADQDHVDFGGIEELGHGIVVCGKHGDFLAVLFHALKHMSGNFCYVGLQISHY